MRIAMVAHTNAPWTPHYARHFLSAGHDVRVVSFSPEPIDGIDVVTLSDGRPSRLPGSFGFAAHLPAARRALRRFGPDVVLATYLSSNGMTAALCWKGPLVVSARGGDVLRQAGYLPGGFLHPAMIRFVCRRASIVHAVSAELATALIGCGVARERIVCFPMGVDVDRFERGAAARTAGAPLHIVCTRRQEPVYANDVVVRALSWLRDRGRDFRCTLAGGGPLLPERIRQIEQLGLADRALCTGQVPLTSVRDLLQSADIYVSASTSDGTSSSLLEAMACGAFPVVTRIRANEPWVRHGETGLLFEPGDASSLGAALEAALAEAALRERAATVNRTLVEHEGNQRVNIDRMMELLRCAAGIGAGEAVPSNSSERL